MGTELTIDQFLKIEEGISLEQLQEIKSAFQVCFYYYFLINNIKQKYYNIIYQYI